MAAYDDKVELHKGRHSTVCSARFIADGQVVAIKAYEKRRCVVVRLLVAASAREWGGSGQTASLRGATCIGWCKHGC